MQVADVAVLGEALIDLVPAAGAAAPVAHPGGSPLNVAVGLARLERPTTFFGRFSRDSYGAVLREHARRSGVDLAHAVSTPAPSTTAFVALDGDGVARYEFTVDGTADFGWTDDELDELPAAAAVLHFGSLASWLPPADEVIARVVARCFDESSMLISYDPNVRPQLQPSATRARTQVERSIATAHLVKASLEDVAYLYPGESIDRVATSWLALGARLVVVTRGPEGPIAFARGDLVVERSVPPITVVDTVGAGDAFTSGLLDGLVRRGLTTSEVLGSLEHKTLAAVLDDAALVAALTCTRAGADPPTLAEVSARRARATR